MDENAEREAFEAWALSMKCSVERDKYGAYIASYTDDMWDGWQARASEAAAGEPVAQWKDPTKELVAKYWTPSEIGNTLTNVTQILDVVRQEWSAEGSWTEWDQSVRDDITSALRAINAAPPAASGQQLTLSPKARDALDSACSFFEIHGFDDYVSELRALLRATASDKP